MVLLIIIILGTVFVHLFFLKERNLFLAFDSSNIKRTLIRKRWSLSWEHKSSYFSFVLISVRIDKKKNELQGLNLTRSISLAQQWWNKISHVSANQRNSRVTHIFNTFPQLIFWHNMKFVKVNEWNIVVFQTN